MDSARYDVEAKADCSGGIVSNDQLSLMIQSLLEDRFQLKAHVETRDMPIYNLVVGKDGHRLKASADQTPPPPPVVVGQLCGTNPEGFKLPSLPPSSRARSGSVQVYVSAAQGCDVSSCRRTGA